MPGSVQRAGHPVLTELLGRIMRQEGRHVDFYATEATRRLERDPQGAGAHPRCAPAILATRRLGRHARRGGGLLGLVPLR